MGRCYLAFVSLGIHSGLAAKHLFRRSRLTRSSVHHHDISRIKLRYQQNVSLKTTIGTNIGTVESDHTDRTGKCFTDLILPGMFGNAFGAIGMRLYAHVPTSWNQSRDDQNSRGREDLIGKHRRGWKGK